VAASLLSLLAIARFNATRNSPASTYSSYDTGRNGYAAFYELLHREDIPSSRFEQPHGLLNRSLRTLIVARPVRHMSQNEAQAIRDWVARGGTLIVLSPDGGDREIPGVRLPQTHTVKGATALAHVLGIVSLTRGVRYLGASGTSVFIALHKPAIPLLGRRHAGVIAALFSFGKGRIIAASDPTIFSNAELGAHDNARFAYNLASTYAPVWFDETAQGYARTENAWHALPLPVRVALGLIGATALLALIGSNVRFGPVIVPAPTQAQNSSAFIDSMASLMERGRARGKAMRDLIDLTLRNVRIQSGDLRAGPVAELQRLRNGAAPRDGDLIRAAVLCAELRKDYGEYGSVSSAHRAAYSERHI